VTGRILHRETSNVTGNPVTQTPDTDGLQAGRIFVFVAIFRVVGPSPSLATKKPLFSVPRAFVPPFVPHFCAARCASRVGEPRYERVLEAPHQEQSGTARPDARPSQCKAPGHDSLLASSPPPRSPFSILRKGSLHRSRYAKPARQVGVVVVVLLLVDISPKIHGGPRTGMGSYSSETPST
jgi:hypothetical protein